MLLAGLDGIQNKIEPPTPIDKDLYGLPPDEHGDIAQVPGSLEAVLAALEADHDYLLAGALVALGERGAATAEAMAPSANAAWRRLILSLWVILSPWKDVDDKLRVDHALLISSAVIFRYSGPVNYIVSLGA